MGGTVLGIHSQDKYKREQPGRRTCSTDNMHDCALERKRKRGLSSAPRVEHTGHCSEISTKTKLSNHIKVDGFFDRNSTNVPVKIVEEKKNKKLKKRQLFIKNR